MGAAANILEENMSQRDNEGPTVKSLVGMLALVAITYLVAKAVPDIIRYLKISKM